MGLFDWINGILFGRRPAPGGSQPEGRTWQSAASRPPATLDGLDNLPYVPITREQLTREAKAGGRGFMWGNPWFGRRDLIPPDTDARTLLIDRAMVTHGLITPEQLAHIHAVGSEMDQVRPAIAAATAAANQAAQQAVETSRETREARKQQKKQAAAERERLRAAAIEERRRTDIVYLGRGVSRGLADRRANIERLQAMDLPVLATPADVAQAMELSISRLRWLAYHSETAARTHYVRFSVPKRSGGVRQLASPHRELRRCQQWIAWHILDKVPVHDAAHGFVRGRSTVTNATAHVAADVIVNTDLKDFFPSITFPRVMGVFRQLGYSPAVATILGLLCTECPRRTVRYAGQILHVATGPRALPQGACTSPALSNLVARRLDARLAGLADKLGWAYTRYADDATFSGPKDRSPQIGYLLARVRHIVGEEGFAVNESKTRVSRANTSQQVTGIVVNRHPGVPRKLQRRMRAILHRAQREGLAAQNRDGHPHFEAWCRGMIAYIAMVNPDQARPLQEALENVA